MKLCNCDILFNKSKTQKGREELARECKEEPHQIDLRDHNFYAAKLMFLK